MDALEQFRSKFSIVCFFVKFIIIFDLNFVSALYAIAHKMHIII